LILSKVTSNLGDFVIQELVHPIDYVMKVYAVFDKIYYFYLNVIDLDAYEDLARIDGAAHLKTNLHFDHHKNEEVKSFVEFIVKMMQDSRYINFGLDIICPNCTKDYYVLDVNGDSASWVRFMNPNEAIDIFRQGLIKVAKKNK